MQASRLPYDGKQLSPELEFFINFATSAGIEIMRSNILRGVGAGVIIKSDETPQIPSDRKINAKLIADVSAQFGTRYTIVGEEEIALSLGSTLTIVIDPTDGSGEAAATHRESVTGNPIPPDVPIPVDALRIEPSERTTCVAIALFNGDVLQFVVVYAPYRDELFVADRTLEGAFLNGLRLDVRQLPIVHQTFEPDIPYDYAYWHGANPDARFLGRVVGPRLGAYSAIYQACQVAKGESAFAVFPGKTLHDIAPAALVAELSGCIVTQPDGQPINWAKLQGAVYSANQRIHDEVLLRINAPRIEGLPPGYSVADSIDITPEEVINLRSVARYGREIRESVWQRALEQCTVVGIRDPRGKLVGIGFATVSIRSAILHDLTVHPEHRWQGIGIFIIKERLRRIKTGYGTPYLYVDVESGKLGVTPLATHYKRLGFVPSGNMLLLNYREKL